MNSSLTKVAFLSIAALTTGGLLSTAAANAMESEPSVSAQDQFNRRSGQTLLGMNESDGASQPPVWSVDQLNDLGQSLQINAERSTFLENTHGGLNQFNPERTGLYNLDNF